MGFLIEYQAIKGLYLVRSRDQGKFLAIKTLDPGRKWFYRAYERDYPFGSGKLIAWLSSMYAGMVMISHWT